MRYVNVNILNADDSASQNGSVIDANQLVSASFQAYFGDTHAAGTLNVQASNDVCLASHGPNTFVPTNWVNIPNASASISAGASALVTIAQTCYRWLRVVYTNTATYKQVQTVTTVPDSAGSLNSTFFLVYSVHGGSPKKFYVWFDDGAGVDPAVPAATGVKVTYTDNASANTLATLIRAALNALTLDFVATGGTNAVIITNVESGAATIASDGSAATGFSFANTTPGVNPTTINVNMEALSL